MKLSSCEFQENPNNSHFSNFGLWNASETQLSLCAQVHHLLLGWVLLANLNTKVIFGPGWGSIEVLPEDTYVLLVALCNSRNKISSTKIPGIILRGITLDVRAQGRPGQAKITAPVQIWIPREKRNLIPHLKQKPLKDQEKKKRNSALDNCISKVLYQLICPFPFQYNTATLPV